MRIALCRLTVSSFAVLAVAVLALAAGAPSAYAQRPLVEQAPVEAVDTALAAAEAQAAAEEADARAAEEAAALPFVYQSARTDLRLVLPAGWDGPIEIDESSLPTYARYQFANAGTEGGLEGVTVIVERVVLLNPLEQQEWRSGRVRYGYHGLRPTAAVDPQRLSPYALAGFEADNGPTTALIAFARRGTVHWTIHASAPTRTFVTQRGAIESAMRSIALSDKALAPPPQARR